MSTRAANKQGGSSTRLSTVECPAREVPLAVYPAIHRVKRFAFRLHSTDLSQRLRPPRRALLELLDLEWIGVLAPTVDVGESVLKAAVELLVDRRLDVFFVCTCSLVPPELPSL